MARRRPNGREPDIAALVRELRREAGLSQRALARKIGTSQPVIARLESAHYDGQSLLMLRRIAAALDRRLIVAFAQQKHEGAP